MTSTLHEVLERSKAEGFLGPGPLDVHLDHAHSLAEAIGPFTGSFCDLGSGGGVPGLVLALDWPDSTVVLLDGSTRRCAFLRDAVDDLGLGDRVTVVEARAEEAGRGPLRATLDLVVARSFAAPSVTAECAAPLLVVGGRLLVAEPPDGGAVRWDREGLTTLGLAYVDDIHGAHARAALMTKVAETDDRFPRRVGIPAKRPLWS